jgi:hypothetical protein
MLLCPRCSARRVWQAPPVRSWRSAGSPGAYQGNVLEQTRPDDVHFTGGPAEGYRTSRKRKQGSGEKRVKDMGDKKRRVKEAAAK